MKDIKYKITYEIFQHGSDIDNYQTFERTNGSSIYGSSFADILKKIVELMSDEKYSYDGDGIKRKYGEDYQSIIFSDIEQIVVKIPFRYEDIAKYYPEFMI